LQPKYLTVAMIAYISMKLLNQELDIAIFPGILAHPPLSPRIPHCEEAKGLQASPAGKGGQMEKPIPNTQHCYLLDIMKLEARSLHILPNPSLISEPAEIAAMI